MIGDDQIQKELDKRWQQLAEEYNKDAKRIKKRNRLILFAIIGLWLVAGAAFVKALVRIIDLAMR